MANSKIILTFNADLNIDETVGFKVSNFQSTYSLAQDFIWKNIRANSGQVTKGEPTNIAGERSAINFIQAYNLGWNFNGSYYTITRVENIVTIEAAFYNTMFFDFVSSTNVSATITNVPQDIFEVDSISFSEADINPCSNVKVTISTSELAPVVNQPVSIPVNNSNPIIVEVLRNSSFNFQANNGNGQDIQKSYLTPPLLDENLFNVVVNNSPFGTTVIVNNTVNNGFTNEQSLSFQYSLDNINWQDSNEYSGLAIGSYTLYIKDHLGCSITKTFYIGELGSPPPYFYISKSNSIRFAERVEWGDSENYKNDENTLSCESDVELAYKEVQQFQSADIITTQFKSNYSSNNVIIKKNGEEIPVPVIQKTNNLGLQDKRDARKYDLEEGKTGVYFISGNKYNYITNEVIGSYTLNGNLPEWAKKGNYISIGNTFYLIEDIVYDDSKNAEIVVFTNEYNGPETNIITGSIYNRFEYEVFEFTINMAQYIDDKFSVEINNTDTNHPTITHLSELLWCKVKHEKVLEISYKNTTNTDVFYSTGIEHKIRIPYLKISAKVDENSETHKTDTAAILLNADLYEGTEFKFEPVTKEIWRKLIIALSHEIVFINGVGYVKNDSFETEGPLENSNLYVLTANMLKTGNVYNSQTSEDTDFNGSEIEIPGLLSIGDGFMKY
ncbi:MAG: hypothetical protein BM557_02200 [Flavobacterium sp. MedPE-SWcel]|uniref:hypothetical protein n=1 Tax=uncultured Flavobacterium sp. TaxID=165435 RepID=UPI00092210CC|nr:hypothetical protein [uncultured Flavobacterium sp.]OIQ22210.1 MAG: hypothetical protein BM557_02200 [Flavobacterium sp. MedPE-SWcel]